jgi:hypothetical protein
MLVQGSGRFHLAFFVKDHLHSRDISQVNPGGLTAYAQTGDIRIFQRFKDKLDRFLHVLWTLTAKGNLRHPWEQTVAPCMKAARKNISQDAINRPIADAGFAQEA